jgi:hypothetical protein
LIALQNLYSSIPAEYDLDNAVGSQLDVIGQWVGISRILDSPIKNVYFSFDIPNLGFDNGLWMGPYDPSTGLVNLPDDYYRLVIKAKILNNHWDGTKGQAYNIIQTIFEPYGFLFYIKDNADLTIDFGLLTLNSENSLIVGLLRQGKFNIKPAGIRVGYYESLSEPGRMFSFDLSNDYFGGFDESNWAVLTNALTLVSSDTVNVVLSSTGVQQNNSSSTSTITI